jgi:site-specific recombinase XerD
MGVFRPISQQEMTMRKLSPNTQSAYIRAVKNFTRFIKRPPDTASAEDLRQFQLYLVEQGIASGNLNATITGLKFFFETTLEHPELMTKMSHVHEPRTLPVIMSLEEMTRLLQSAGGPKYQAALGVAYGAGLRANEVVHLSVGDIDSERMVIRVEQGKGKRDRYLVAPCSRTKTNVARRLVVPGTKPREPLNNAAAQSRLPSGTQGREDRQGCVAAFLEARICHSPA